MNPSSITDFPLLQQADNPWTTREIRLSPRRTLKATPVFDAYWAFAAERQRIFMRRVLGSPYPWTDDPVLRRFRFTNAYRAADRVSQYLIRHVLYQGPPAPEEVFFRALLFKLFNRIDTWDALVSRFGIPTACNYRPEVYARAFDTLFERGAKLYSAAYIVPNPKFGHPRKHRNHLQLLQLMLRDETPDRVANAHSLEAVYAILRSFPSVGPFLAFQFAIDLNYSTVVDFSEMDFVVAGPGARDGIRRCFADTAGLSDADLIRAVSDLRETEFARLGIQFPDLWGRPLQLIDLQNLFCEVDKYARVTFPSSPGASARKRIKRLYRPAKNSIPQWYPPKWSLDLPPSLSSGLSARSADRAPA